MMASEPVKLNRTYRVVREWSISKADYTYACYQTTHWEDKEDTEQRMATGDRDWAEKNAEHYGVEIVEYELPDESSYPKVFVEIVGGNSKKYSQRYSAAFTIWINAKDFVSLALEGDRSFALTTAKKFGVGIIEDDRRSPQSGDAT